VTLHSEPGDAEDPQQRHFSTKHLLTDLKGRTISSGLVTFSSQGVQFVLTMASTMVMARLLNPADFGLVAMGLTAMGFFNVLRAGGLSTATVQREDITHSQVSTLFWINTGLSAVTTVLLAACTPLIAKFFEDPRLVPVTLALSLTFLLSGATAQHLALLNRQMRFKALAAIQIGSQVGSIALGIVLASLGFGYWSLVAAQVALPFFTFVLTWSTSGWRPQWPQRGSGVRPMLGFGANLTVTTFIYSLANSADNLVIGRYFGPGPVGLYSRAVSLLRRPLDQFLTPINVVFVPVLSRVQNQPDRYRRTLMPIYGAITLFCCGFTGIIFGLARPITLVVLGPKWEEAAVLVAAFALTALYIPPSYVCGWLFESQGRGKDALRTSLLSSLAMITAIFAGFSHGAAGIAISISIAGLVLQLPIFFYMVGRSGPIRTSDMWSPILKHLPVALVAAGTSYAVQSWASRQPAIAQFLLGGFVAVTITLGFVVGYAPARRTAWTAIQAVQEFLKTRARATATQAASA
jgi:O-antigen/teichoic acid export membrane protein